tara:strand:+ start:5334 stop:5495 length:162 start_codon:yes stop_codon:yes gene_type:complete
MIKKETLKEYKSGDPIPWDFWNYNINIILGWKHNKTVIKDTDWKKYKNDSTSQ